MMVVVRSQTWWKPPLHELTETQHASVTWAEALTTCNGALADDFTAPRGGTPARAGKKKTKEGRSETEKTEPGRGSVAGKCCVCGGRRAPPGGARAASVSLSRAAKRSDLCEHLEPMTTEQRY